MWLGSGVAVAVVYVVIHIHAWELPQAEGAALKRKKKRRKLSLREVPGVFLYSFMEEFLSWLSGQRIRLGTMRFRV